MASCAGPGCKRPTVAGGLCAAHYKQHVRKRPLTPIRQRGNPLKPLATRIPQATLDALGDRPGEKAREILNRWARRPK